MRFAALTVLLLTASFSACIDTGQEPGTEPPAEPYALDCRIAPGMGDNGTWPHLCLALASPNDSPSKSEVDIAVNPKDPSNIVVASKDKDPLASNDCVWSVAQVTKDGGKTWKTVYVGGDRAHRVPLTAQYECVTDPIMVFDANGVFYYALQIYDHTPRGNQGEGGAVLPDTGSAFILARSLDGGITYDNYALQAEGAGDMLFHDYPRMIVNPKTGAVHTIWNAYWATTPVGLPVDAPAGGPAGVFPVVSSSRDGGETVDKPLILADEDSPDALAFFSGFAATKDGTIYVTMQKDENSDAGDRTTVWIWKSTDDARSFQEVGSAFQIDPTPRQHGNHSYRTPSFVEMAIDSSDGPHAGRIYLFWPEWTNEQSDILSSFSDDGAQTWSEPVNIAKNATRNQYFMRPTVGPDGTVHVLFTTQAYSGSELLDQVHAWSEDGGLTWDNLRLTTVSWDGDLGVHQDGFPFIGDYNGIRVGPDGVVHAAWGDTATGRAEIAYARILPAT